MRHVGRESSLQAGMEGLIIIIKSPSSSESSCPIAADLMRYLGLPVSKISVFELDTRFKADALKLSSDIRIGNELFQLVQSAIARPEAEFEIMKEVCLSNISVGFAAESD